MTELSQIFDDSFCFSKCQIIYVYSLDFVVLVWKFVFFFCVIPVSLNVFGCWIYGTEMNIRNNDHV
jgi:hypothetical protein